MYGETSIKNGTIKTVCRQCDMHCGIIAEIVEGRIVKIRGNPEHPINRGRLCPKGPAAIDTVYHRDRLLKPLKKNNRGGFDEIPLATAMAEISERLFRVADTYGKPAVGAWQGEALGFAQQEMYPRRFLHGLGSPNFLSVNSLCYVSRYIAFRLVQGYWNPYPDYRNARCILFWGTNPPVSHCIVIKDVKAAREAGAKLVVIDPRSTAISRDADLHLQIMPGTDGALAWCLIGILIDRGKIDREFIRQYTVGFNEVSEYASTCTSSWASRITGLSEEKILECAEMIIKGVPKVVNYPGVSLEHQENGVDTVRTIAILGGIVGALDRRGGDFWPEPMKLSTLSLYDEIPLRNIRPLGAEEYPVLYDFYRECNTMKGLDAMLGKGPYPLKALLLCGGNPVNTNPNVKNVKKAFQSLDLLVVRDLFMTETAALADYVLPAASFLERSEIHTYSDQQWVALSHRVFTIPEVVDEYTFWRDLSHRLGFGEKYFPWRNEDEVNTWLLGPAGLSLEDFKAHPEGKEYTPLRYGKYEEKSLSTPSGKLECTSSYLEELGYPPLPVYKPPFYVVEKKDEYPYLCITGARKRVYLHSRYRNIPRFRKIYSRGEIEIHPGDARALQVREGEYLRVTSEVGALELPVKIVGEADILPGIIQITHGWEGRENVNLLTFDTITDPISGFPLLTSIPVQLNRIL